MKNDKKTILNQGMLRLRKLSAIAAAFTLAASVTACGPTQYEHEDIANLKDHKNARLVQGRDNCIQELVSAGKTAAESAKICDDVMAAARAEAQKNGNTTVVHHDNSNAFLFWYLMMPRGPSVYYGNPGGGLNYYGGASGVGTPSYTPPPKTLNSAQTQYLSAAPGSARTSIAAKLAATPGARLSPVSSSAGKGSTSVTSRGGMSTGKGVATGG